MTKASLPTTSAAIITLRRSHLLRKGRGRSSEKSLMSRLREGHLSEKKAREEKRENNASDETICYMFGLPLEVTSEDLNNEFSKRQIHSPLKIEKIKKDDDFGNDCMYVCMTFDVAVSVDRLLEKAFTVFNKPVLVIPKVESMPVKKQIPFHQVLVTFSPTTPGFNLFNQNTAKQEIDYLTRFFNKHGDIVDLNLDYVPYCIVVTYTRHESVLRLIQSKTITYNSSTQDKYLLSLHKMNFVLPIRSNGWTILHDFTNKAGVDGKSKDETDKFDALQMEQKRDPSQNSIQNAQGNGE
uniref:Uncharacterized protein n=1 Tax=Euplotes harpa TaxID=151035 RepID=A0A7S3N8K9_9SPIT|mmetsp:Transcript_23788/g.27357  ORF Transcript_23788/g.27357 Transcript_23788/m.27357 type:complete len:296 (+) Transcript_23788:116-1003(+)